MYLHCRTKAGILALVVVASAAPLAAATKAGFAERDITPAVGSERPGGYVKAHHDRLSDPCKVRAAVFDDGERVVVVVGVDALVVPRKLVLASRRRIEKLTGIPSEGIMIAASHSHTSGPTGMVQPGQYDHASDLVQELAYDISSAADPDYLKRVEDAIVDAVVEADKGAAEAVCGFGSGREDQVAFNRRFRMKNGLVATHPRQGNPGIVSVAGPTDPEVGVIAAFSEDGRRLLGCIVNFACHATTSRSGGGISANYIYYLEKVIRGTFGDDVVVVFTPGASGDVSQVDNQSPHRHRNGDDASAFVGGRVGAEAVKVLLTMTKGAGITVDARGALLKIQRRVPKPERIERAWEVVEQPLKNVDPVEWTFAKELVLLDALLEEKPVADVEIQIIQIGPAVLAANPAEYFCQYGLDIKAKSKFAFTFPVTLANGAVGYVPTEEALGPKGGGYETRLTSYSNLIPTAGTTMAKEAIRLIEDLSPGEVPSRNPAPRFSGVGWPYGNAPPERH